MPKQPPQTIGINPLDQLVPYASTAAIAGNPTGKGRTRAPARPDSTVLTITVPSELADRLEQVIAVMPGLDLDSLACEALEAVWAKLQKRAKPLRRDVEAAPKGRSAASAKKAPRSAHRDADGHGRKVVVILGE